MKQQKHKGKEFKSIGPSHEEISRHAFNIYLAHGQVPGNEVEDWHQAEAELNNTQSKSLLVPVVEA